MTYTGTITRIQRSRAGVTLIVDLGYSLRGIELDSEEWAAILDDFGLSSSADITGWSVEYNPANGDLEITGPDDSPDSGV